MLVNRSIGAALFALVLLLAPEHAKAGPYASPAMGRGVSVNLPLTLHAGGSFGAGLGRTQDTAARSMLGGGFLEGQMGDVALLGLGVHAQSLPDLPQPLGARATALEVRLGFRAPLVGGSHRGSVAVPFLALRGTVGAGWLAEVPPGSDRRFGRYGVHLAFELVMRRRITPFVSVGYSRTSLGDAPPIRQAELTIGVSFLLAGDRAIEPRRRREPVEVERDRGRTERLMDELRHLRDDDD